MRYLLVIALVGGAALSVSPRAGAQTAAPDDLVAAIRDARDRLDYATAEARAREALDRFGDLSPGQLVEVHTVLGIVLHARGEDAEARAQLGAALSLDPNLTLDPVLVSPKTLALFDEVRSSRAAQAASPDRPAPPRYVVLRDRRPGGAIRSAALPGWGQFHKGDTGRGWAYAVGVGVSAAGAVAAHAGYLRARGRYQDATIPSEIESAYDDASRLYRLRNGLSALAALGWAASVVDALTTGAPQAPPAAAEVQPAGGGVALRIRF